MCIGISDEMIPSRPYRTQGKISLLDQLTAVFFASSLATNGSYSRQLSHRLWELSISIHAPYDKQVRENC
jgi:hypothetical protein